MSAPASRVASRVLVALVVVLTFLSVAGASPVGAQEEAEERTEEPILDEDAGTGDDDELEAPQAIKGRLQYRDPDEGNVPVTAVPIEVRTPEGQLVGEDASDEDGNFRVPVEEPGSYVVSIDESALPDGVTLRSADRSELTVSLAPGQVGTVLFALVGEGGVTRSADRLIDRAARLFVLGIRFGLIIGLSAVGLSLIFGTTGLVNFAHGELVTFGALMAWIFNALWDIPFLTAAALAVITGAVFGALLDHGFWRPLRNRGTGLIAMLVITIGMSLLLRYIFLYQFGGSTRRLSIPIRTGSSTFGPITVTHRDLQMIAVAAIVLVAVALVLQFTKIGKAMRAVSDNRDLAESSGIDVERVIMFVWAGGAGLAALGGVLLGVAEQVSWVGGFNLLLLMFAGVILGGLGTAYGALVGSLVVGVLIQMSTIFVPTELKNVVALFVLIVILLIRPQGILGQAERIG